MKNIRFYLSAILFLLIPTFEMRDSDHLKRNMYVTADNNPLQLTASSTKR